jgi:RNA polymerase sigma-70 factor (ECF subfamily)
MLRAYARTGLDPVFAEDTPAEDTRELASALAELRRDEREILLLHAWAELTDTEIAAALGIPAGTVKSRLSRTREKLRNRLEPVGQEAV